MKKIIIRYPVLVLWILFAVCSPVHLFGESQKLLLQEELKTLYNGIFNQAMEAVEEIDSGTIETLVRKLPFLNDISAVNNSSTTGKRKYLRKLIAEESKKANALLEKQLSKMDEATILSLKTETEAVEEYLYSLQSNPKNLPKGFCPVSEAVLESFCDIEQTPALAPFLLICDLVAKKTSKGIHNYADNAEEPDFLQWKDIKLRIEKLVAAYPSIVSLHSLGKTLEGREIPLLKISDNVNSDENEPEILYTAGMHPREQQPVVCLLSFLEDLLTKYGKDEQITRLINEREIWLVPLLNVDGRIHDFRRGTTANKRNNWRKNRRRNPDGTRGVDINRNFPVRWVRTTNKCYLQDYPGSGPASEPETKALMRFISSRQLSMYADLHSYMGANIVPRYISDSEALIYAEILHNIEKLQKKPYVYKEPHGSEVPPQNPTKGAGLGFVWAYYTQGVRSINIEVKGNGFYHTTSSCKLEYTENIRAPLLYLAQMCDSLAMPKTGKASLIDFNSNKVIKPGALISLKTKISSDFDYAVLVSNSAQVRVLSEYRIDPSLNGFTIKIMPNAKANTNIPMFLYTWDSNRGRSVITFDLKIN